MHMQERILKLLRESKPANNQWAEQIMESANQAPTSVKLWNQSPKAPIKPSFDWPDNYAR